MSLALQRARALSVSTTRPSGTLNDPSCHAGVAAIAGIGVGAIVAGFAGYMFGLSEGVAHERHEAGISARHRAAVNARRRELGLPPE